MKRTAMAHTKLKKLCRRLNVPAYAAVGILECLWHLTAREAPRGDIGRVSDEDIALALEWDGDIEALIETLVTCGWLDRSPQYRLVVHDWHEHADETVKKAVSRSGQGFASADEVKPAEAPGTVIDTLSGSVATCPENGRNFCHIPPRAWPQPEPEPEPEPCQSLARASALPEPVPAPQPEPAPEVGRFTVVEIIEPSTPEPPPAESKPKATAWQMPEPYREVVVPLLRTLGRDPDERLRPDEESLLQAIITAGLTPEGMRLAAKQARDEYTGRTGKPIGRLTFFGMAWRARLAVEQEAAEEARAEKIRWEAGLARDRREAEQYQREVEAARRSLVGFVMPKTLEEAKARFA